MEKVTKEQFESYCNLQDEGNYNMLDPMVREICNLTREEHIAIMENYVQLEKKYK